MAYELHLKAETIAELAHAVQQHHEELSVITGQTVAMQNQVAATSVLEDGDNFTMPHVSQTFVAREVQPNPSTSTVDADGLPWDERIHSSNRKMTARGVWTRRKNVDDAVYNSVVAELRGAPQAPITGAFAAELPQPAAAWTAAPQVEQAAPAPATVFLQSVVNPAPAPVAAQAVYAPTAPTINDLFVKLQQLSKEGVFTAQYNSDLIGALIQQFQVHISSINDIAARPDMIAAAFQFIAARGN